MFRYRILPAISLLLALIPLGGCEKPADPNSISQKEFARPAKIVPVVSAGISLLRSYPGTLEASQRAELAFRIGGQLAELPARAGLRVKKGDLLARLDDTDYQNTLDERQSRFDLAKIQFDQASKLLKQKLSSQLQYDQAGSELKSARAALDQARDNLRYTRLVAPFDGIVAHVDVKNHQAIQAKSPIIRLQNEDQLDIRFSIPESTISQLKRIEDPSLVKSICANTRFSTHPHKTYQACHKEHESVPDPLTRNYSVVFSIEQITEFTALPGMTASIELDLSGFLPGNSFKGLLVPVEAVFEKENKKWVWIVDSNMRTKQTEVETGRFEGEMLEITSGLSTDNKIVAAGVSYIREGMLVKPMIKERGL